VARNLDAATLARLRQDIVSVQQAHTPYTAYIERNRNPVAPLTLDQQLRLINELDRNIP
jgi:hypothetical protein